MRIEPEARAPLSKQTLGAGPPADGPLKTLWFSKIATGEQLGPWLLVCTFVLFSGNFLFVSAPKVNLLMTTLFLECLGAWHLTPWLPCPAPGGGGTLVVGANWTTLILG